MPSDDVASLKKELAETRNIVKHLQERIEHGESFDTTYGKLCIVLTCRRLITIVLLEY